MTVKKTVTVVAVVPAVVRRTNKNHQHSSPDPHRGRGVVLSLIVYNTHMSFIHPAYAQCPACIVTVGGGMLLAKKLGIDDFLVSIWISALNTVISFWLAPKLRLKYLRNPHLFSLLMLGLTLSYFKITDQINGHNQLLGIDKIIFGQILGFLIIGIANHAYLFIKRKLGHTPFPYAKVAFPFGLVLIVTLVFKFAFKL